MALRGAAVVAVARREDRLAALAEQVAGQGGRIEVVAGDVTDASLRGRVIETVQQHFGGLDILVNNAGVGAHGRFEDAAVERLRAIFEVNFFAAVELTRLAMPLLIRSETAAIVNVSSILGHRATPFNSEYCASKFALRGFSDALRAEVTRHGIRVLVVSPGTTQTEFGEHLLERTPRRSWRKPRAVSAEVVAEKTIQAIERGKREIIPHFPSRMVFWLNRAAPGLLDRILARMAR
jgi:short-subunit dehydrogenase